MEWNLRTPLQWEWENVAFFNGKESEMSTFTSGGVISNGSMYSSVSGTSSGSDLGNGSSRSSVSASVGSSSKVGIQVSELNFESVECFPGNLHKNDESIRGEDTKTSPAVIGSSGAAEPPIGLKLGKRTYFENFGAANTKASSSAVSVAPSALLKTSWVSHQATQNAYCQVEGCNIDLIAAKGYHRRHRVCESHSKSPKVTISGQERRFCQQCSRFHDLSEFDNKKRSCRKRLSEHNARRRKPQPETSFNFPRLSSSFFGTETMLVGADEKQQMNFFLNRAPFSITPSASTLWEESSSVFSLPTSKVPWPKPTKAGVGLPHLPVIDFSNNFPASVQGFDEITPFKSTTAEVLCQGLEASVSASNLNGSPDLRRALSLLSKDSCGPTSTRQNNMIQFATTNPAAALHPPVQAASSTSDCWQDEHSQLAVAFRFQVNASQFQELHLSKAPYEGPLFEANQVFSKEFCYPAQFKAQDHPKSTF